MTSVVNITKTKRYDVYIGRGGPYGNPFDHNKLGITRKECIEKYREYFYKKLNDPVFRDRILGLKDKVLGCFCKPEACHGDVIVDYIDNYEKKQRMDTDRVIGANVFNSSSDDDGIFFCKT